MKFTRIRLIALAFIGAFLLFGAACAGSLGGGDANDDEAAPPGEPDAGVEDSLSSINEYSYSDYSNGGDDVVLKDVETAPGYESARASGRDGAPPANPQLANMLDRKIIQSTSVDIKVKEVGRNFPQIIRIAETAGGFVASSAFSNVDDEQVADITIRVPGDQYQGVLAQIRGMGEVVTESSDANDVTEEYTDLQARLRTLEATEGRYLELLGEANEINEILQVQDRLDGVRGQIEQVQGRINMLEHLTDLATITVHLRPEAAIVEPTPSDGGPDPLDAAASAWDTSLQALRGLAAGLLVVAVFSWWLLPPVALLAVGARWWLGRRPRPAVKPAV